LVRTLYFAESTDVPLRGGGVLGASRANAQQRSRERAERLPVRPRGAS